MAEQPLSARLSWKMHKKLVGKRKDLSGKKERKTCARRGEVRGINSKKRKERGTARPVHYPLAAAERSKALIPFFGIDTAELRGKSASSRKTTLLDLRVASSSLL